MVKELSLKFFFIPFLNLYILLDEKVIFGGVLLNYHEPENQTEAVLHDFKAGLGIFSKKMPLVAKKYNEFTEECFKEGALSKKEKQLIALGISVFSQDEYCMVYHVKGCLDEGAAEDEILEAASVAAAFGGGAAISQAVTLVQDSINDLNGSLH
jgi:AhpD family alkylhydroperoxidase